MTEPEMTRDFCQDRMLGALNEYSEFTAGVAQIRAEVEEEIRVARETHPRLIGGRQNPLRYDVDIALKNHYYYVQARQDRDAARWTAIMWGVAALVQAQEEAVTC